MKRPIAIVLCGLALAQALSGCSSPAPSAATERADDGGWVATPRVETVTVQPPSIIVRGQAAPSARVVLTAPGGQAYAVGASEDGGFELRLPTPAADVVFEVESRVGQERFPSVERLLVGAEGQGPIALLAIGAPTRRLDAAPALDAVDTDGRAGFVSGRAAAKSPVSVIADRQMETTTGSSGRWSFPVGAGPASVVIGDAIFRPVLGAPGDMDRLVRAGDGWVIAWQAADGARQTTWFPDGSPATSR